MKTNEVRICNVGSLKGFEDYKDYSVTSDGDVISHKRKEDLILKQRCDRYGYLSVGLCYNNKRKTIYIAPLVAKAFCKGYSEELEVNHKDEDKTNNNYKNLEWITHKYNINYGTSIERRAEANSKPVAQLTLKGRLVKIWKSAAQADKQGGFTRQHISSTCLGKYKTSGGFKWKFV